MEDLENAIKIVKEGGIVIFPTDTAFGIGCRMDSEQSVKKLFEIRKRPVNQATPVLVSSVGMAEVYFFSPLPDNVRHLMDKYWPGGLTIVYSCQDDKVPSLVRGGRENLGVRMPDHGMALKLIEGVDVPILGPSANFHGDKTPYTYNDLDPDLVRLADYVLKGDSKIGHVSTVVDCSVVPWKILRQGAIKIEKEDLV